MHSIKEVQNGMQIFQTLKGEKPWIAGNLVFSDVDSGEKRTHPTFEQTQ